MIYDMYMVYIWCIYGVYIKIDTNLGPTDRRRGSLRLQVLTAAEQRHSNQMLASHVLDPSPI